MSREVRYFGPHREPAVLVEDFGELSKPRVFYYANCRNCGGNHRFMPIAPAGHCADGRPRAEIVPASSCAPNGSAVCVCACCVEDRAIFAVIDEPPAKAESRTRRRKLVTS